MRAATLACFAPLLLAILFACAHGPLCPSHASTALTVLATLVLPGCARPPTPTGATLCATCGSTGACAWRRNALMDCLIARSGPSDHPHGRRAASPNHVELLIDSGAHATVLPEGVPLDDTSPSRVRIRSCHGNVKSAVDQGTLRLPCLDAIPCLDARGEHLDLAVPDCHRVPGTDDLAHERDCAGRADDDTMSLKMDDLAQEPGACPRIEVYYMGVTAGRLGFRVFCA